MPEDGGTVFAYATSKPSSLACILHRVLGGMVIAESKLAQFLQDYSNYFLNTTAEITNLSITHKS